MIKITDEYQAVLNRIHTERGYVLHVGAARPISGRRPGSDHDCVHEFVWPQPQPNEPLHARCANCGTWWILEHATPRPRRPIPWGCFKMFHIGRSIRLPLIDRAV